MPTPKITVPPVGMVGMPPEAEQKHMPPRQVAAPTPAPHPEAVTMSVRIANAIYSNTRLPLAELHLAIEHYRALQQMLLNSGPQFTNAARDAAKMGNRAIDRIKIQEAEEAQKAAEKTEQESGLRRLDE